MFQETLFGPPNKDKELQEKTRQMVTNCLQTAETLWPDHSFPLPTIFFKKKGRAAGTANTKRYDLNFNMVLLRENSDKFAITVIHECAHLVARKVYGMRIKPHGKQWRIVMQKLGISEPKRCHSYDISKSSTLKRKYIYRCSCRDHRFTSIRHNRAKKGTKYHCTKCLETLVYTNLEYRRI